jgi:two-component system NtrC family sensor kinase
VAFSWRKRVGNQARSARPPKDNPLMKYLSSVKEITVTFRWLVILLLLLFLVFPPQAVGAGAYRWFFILFLVFIVSNTILSFVPEERFRKLRLNSYVFLVDVFLISLTIYVIQGFDSDLFLIYFIVIFVATLSSTGLKRSLSIGLIAALLYFGFYLRNHPLSSLMTSYMLLRIPFFFLLAFISTFHSEQLKGEVARREKAEEKSARIIDQYKALVNTIPDIIYELDSQGRFTFLSEAIEQLGFSPRELFGKHFAQIIHPEDRENVSREIVLVRLKNQGQFPKEPPKLFDERRTGSRMTKNLSVRLLLKNPQPDRPPFIFAEVHSSGKWKVDPVTKAKVLAGSIGIIRDVTENTMDKLAVLHKNLVLETMNQELTSSLKELEQKTTDLSQTQAQLLQSEKLASIGELAAGVAHEVSNPLSFLSSNLGVLFKNLEAIVPILRSVEDLKSAGVAGDEAGVQDAAGLLTKLGAGIDIPYFLEDIDDLVKGTSDGLERIKKIVLDLRTFSRKDEGARIPSDLNGIIDGVLNIVWNEIKFKAELKKDYGTLPEVNCNPQQIGQVIINMLLNAVQALAGKGTITIRTFARDDKAIIEIADTGQGMTPEIKDRIFEPFFTTKPASKGTGLGLSISLDIVRKHGGTIEVESQPGVGTTFTISLPVGSQS